MPYPYSDQAEASLKTHQPMALLLGSSDDVFLGDSKTPDPQRFNFDVEVLLSSFSEPVEVKSQPDNAPRSFPPPVFPHNPPPNGLDVAASLSAKAND
mmetsp:Transcript_13390/g.20138  ORF Transcript_13390/g.20138 Transcript_13390/m.20138 type:complete len:97 (-) Transcript_13390:787-1077(-)